MMSELVDNSITMQPITRQEIELVKKDIMELKGQMNHFKSLYQDIKKEIREMKQHFLFDDNSEQNQSNSTISVKSHNGTEEFDNTYTNEETKNDINTPLVNNQVHDIEMIGPDDVVTIPLLYGMIRRNAKKVEPNNNFAKTVEAKESIKIADKIVFPDDKENDEATNGYLHKKKRACKNKTVTENMVSIGSGITEVPRTIYENIKWGSYTMATRKLLMAVFSRRVLATHCLTGKPSPAFANKPAKDRTDRQTLDRKKVSDIIIEVTNKCKVKENLVRNAITTKCADENKMMRIQDRKRSGKF